MIIHLRYLDRPNDSNRWICGEHDRGSHDVEMWCFVHTAADPTPFAFVMPYAWEGCAICVDCARRAIR